MQVSQRDLDNAIENAVTRMIAEFNKGCKPGTKESNSPNPTTDTATQGNTGVTNTDGIAYKLWSAPNKLYLPFPEDFEFPRCTVQPICHYFVFGDATLGIRRSGEDVLQGQ